MKRSCNGVRSGHLDSTFSLTVSGSLDEDRSTLSPSGSPRVLDLPIFLSTFGSIAVSQDSVVEVGAAVSTVDSLFVELEGDMVGLDGN